MLFFEKLYSRILKANLSWARKKSNASLYLSFLH